MTAIADEIRAATARNELHPLVAKNIASPLGICNGSVLDWPEGGRAWCTLDYGHEGDCLNDAGERELAKLGAELEALIEENS